MGRKQSFGKFIYAQQDDLPDPPTTVHRVGGIARAPNQRTPQPAAPDAHDWGRAQTPALDAGDRDAVNDFGLDNLVFGEAATPVPKAGELLVKVGAVSLNFRDKAIIDGFYEPHLVPKPLIPVSDASGTVVAVGEGVSRFSVGDRVNSHLYSRWIDGEPGPNEPDYCFGMPYQVVWPST